MKRSVTTVWVTAVFALVAFVGVLYAIQTGATECSGADGTSCDRPVLGAVVIGSAVLAVAGAGLAIVETVREALAARRRRRG